jgi:hypothetical protein
MNEKIFGGLITVRVVYYEQKCLKAIEYFDRLQRRSLTSKV